MIDSASALISAYVEKDPTKSCTYAEYKTGVSTLKEFCRLRCESVAGQLNGTIPSTSQGQEDNASALVDASAVDLSAMGDTIGGGWGNWSEESDESNEQTLPDPSAPAESSEPNAGEADAPSTSDTARSNGQSDASNPPKTPAPGNEGPRRGGMGGGHGWRSSGETSTAGQSSTAAWGLIAASALVLLAGLLAARAAKGTGTAAPATTLYEGTRPTAVNTAMVNGKTILSATEIYNSNLPAVVGINGSVTTNVWGQTVRNAVSGSGFVISSDGYIITNYHVVDGVSDITVFFSNGDSYDATVVGGEEDNDIAILKIEATGLQSVVLGDSDAIQIGENVYAVGNPLGELTFTLTGGYVSAKDREITMSSGTVMNMIQTDAAINSGGPLFDQYGQVVGMSPPSCPTPPARPHR